MNATDLTIGGKYKDNKNNYNNLVFGGSYDKLDYKCTCCAKNLVKNNSYEFATFKDENVIANLINEDGSMNLELWGMASGYFHYGSECVKKHICKVAKLKLGGL